MQKKEYTGGIVRLRRSIGVFIFVILLMGVFAVAVRMQPLAKEAQALAEEVQTGNSDNSPVPEVQPGNSDNSPVPEAQIIGPGKAAIEITTLKLKKTEYIYNGKQKKPSVSVFDANGKIVEEKYYKVTYKNHCRVGAATVKVTIKDKYKSEYCGSLKETFYIYPSKTSFKKVSPEYQGFSVKWKKKDEQVGGYELEYSTSSGFKKTKTTVVTYKKTKNSAKISGLKGGKRYYVRIRTYKMVKGKKYVSKWSKVKTVTTKKYLVVIDAGHQDHANTGKEPNGPGSSVMKMKVTGGTKGCVTGLYEYQLNLTVAKKLRDVLEARGYEVIMVRDTNDVDITNIERAKVANEAGADAFIRIHANSSTSSSVYGAMTICQTSHNPYNASWYKKSRKLSDCVLDHLVSQTGCKKNSVWETDTMTGINWCNVPVTIVEMGYMSNPAEDRRMATESYQDKIAAGIADGIDAYFGK